MHIDVSNSPLLRFQQAQRMELTRRLRGLAIASSVHAEVPGAVRYSWRPRAEGVTALSGGISGSIDKVTLLGNYNVGRVMSEAPM